MTAKPSPLPLPGYGLPVSWTPTPCNKSEMRARTSEGEAAEPFSGPRLFTNGWHLCAEVRDDDVRVPLLTLMEIDMLTFMSGVTDSAGWELDSYLNEETLARWLNRQRLGQGPWSFSEETFTYVFQELRYKAKVFKETGLITVCPGDVVKSDVAIPKNLLERLKVAAAALEVDVLTSRRRKRKGIVRIVDPNRFNVNLKHTKVIEDGVLNRETCLQRMNSGSPSRIPYDPDSYRTFVGSYWAQYTADEMELRDEYRKYGITQWLPCDVDISGDVPKILTYINNLHPRDYAPLYTILEEILEKVIPAWNVTLTPLRTFRFKRRIKFTAPDYGDIEKWMAENGPKMEDFKDEEYPEHAFNNAQDKLYESKAQDFLREPQVSEGFKEPDPSGPVVDLKADYGDRGLQVVVRMRNVYLAPKESTLSDCPDWHLEGIPNDHICAVANYYYDVENVHTRGRLSFVPPQKANPSFDQNKLWHTLNYNWLQAVFGVQDGKCSNHEAGRVDVPEGRLVTFPNLLFSAHRQFELVDKTKDGHCKVLTLLLVDPNIRVISSAIVPCQQYDWWVKEVIADGGPLSGLPYDVRLEIMKHIRKWSWAGTEYPKADQEKDILFKRRNAHTKFPGLSRWVSDGDDDSD